MSLCPNRTDRRGFLTVGALTGVGLTLGDYFRLQQARGEQKNYDFIEAKAKSVIHIFLPGGIAHQETFDPKPFAPIEYRGELEPIPTKIAGEQFSETLPQTAADRRQDHRHPLDDARRGGPRARHAQHVHRLSAQPGLAVSRAWAAWSATNTARATTCRRTSAFRTSRTNSPAPAI